MNFNLADALFRQASRHPERIALHVSGESYSYGDLADWSARVATRLGTAQRVGVLASRSLGAYVGLLGACFCGAAYVPLSPKLPEERLSRILEIVGLDALIVDEVGLARLTPALRATAPPLVVDLSAGVGSLPLDRLPAPVECGSDELAYILFTSGTTGTPKGVMVSLGSVAQFLAAMRHRFATSPSDRIAQMSELTFDVSVFEMFSAWGVGASVYVVPAAQLMAPARFIVDCGLTVWSSVPSVAAFMRRMKMLKPGAFPSLRYSVFAGEVLPYSLADAWKVAASSSVVENLYGPTEATVYCLGATAGPDFPPAQGRDTVPSGIPLPGVGAAILDESLTFQPRGTEGQLAISGGQLAAGYYGEPELTARSFRLIGDVTWYLTGDRAVQDERGNFHHLGRIDHQVKILGQRVEIEEVEVHLRAICGSGSVAVVAWPLHDGIAGGLVGFTSGVAASAEQLREAMRRVVPSYMVPRRIVELPALPLGSSGKIDRRALTRYLEGTEEDLGEAT